jgi:hypothetical protein
MVIMAKKCFLVLGLATGMFATPAMGIDVRKLPGKLLLLFCFVGCLVRCYVCSLFSERVRESEERTENGVFSSTMRENESTPSRFELRRFFLSFLFLMLTIYMRYSLTIISFLHYDSFKFLRFPFASFSTRRLERESA